MFPQKKNIIKIQKTSYQANLRENLFYYKSPYLSNSKLHRENKQTDITTYRLNRPRGQFSENSIHVKEIAREWRHFCRTLLAGLVDGTGMFSTNSTLQEPVHVCDGPVQSSERQCQLCYSELYWKVEWASIQDQLQDNSFSSHKCN